MRGKFISYLRVSTDKQGVRGYGIAAQRKAVKDYLDGGRWQLLGEFVEVESGRRNDRPQLARAPRHLSGFGDAKGLRTGHRTRNFAGEQLKWTPLHRT